MTDPYDVVVVGAGAAGLAAARELQRLEKRVLLLEARSRAGGRIDTRMLPGCDAPAELGAEFVHGRPEVTLSLLKEAGIGLVAVGEEQVELHSGTLRRTPDRFDAVEKMLARVDRGAPDESLDAFLDRVAGDRAMREARLWTRALVEGFDAADPADVSVQSIAEEWSGGASLENGEFRPEGGYANAIAHLVRSLDPEQVHVAFDAVVERIAWNDRVSVQARVNGALSHFDARRAIVTLPVGVLQRNPLHGGVTFAPDLPNSKREALNAIAMGPVTKLVLQFRDRFWENARGGDYSDVSFFQSTESPFHTFWTPMPLHAPLLVAWAGGSQTRQFRNLDDGERVTRALESLATIFDVSIDDVRDQLVVALQHDWQRDPFARGAYSYALVGAGDARARLAKPLGPLHFAGEATAETREAGTVAGALLSGLRAAREIAAS